MTLEWEPSTPEPLAVDCELLKRFCRVVDDFEAPVLQMLAEAAAELIETETRLQLRTQTRTAELPVTGPAETITVPLPRAPFLAAEVLAIDSGGSETEIPAGSVRHDRRAPGCLRVSSIPAGTVLLRVTYRAGFESLPQVIRLLVFQLVAHWYEHRETATADGRPQEIPLSYSHIVRSLDTYQDAVR